MPIERFYIFYSRQVILVGHSSGGACISYALEHLPDKISKAIFLCATMVHDGQRPFDAFAEQVCYCIHSMVKLYHFGKLNFCGSMS